MISLKDYQLEDIGSIIDADIEKLRSLVNGHILIKDKVNVDLIAVELKKLFINQLNRANPHDEIVIAIKSKFPTKYAIYRGEKMESFDQMQDELHHYMTSDDFRRVRVEWAKFKNKYIIWAKNFLAKLNGIKIKSKCSWFNIRPFAELLTKLELEEALTKDDDVIPDMIKELVDGMIETMLHDVMGAEVRNSLIRDHSTSYIGDVVGRDYFNSFPKWYREIGAKNQEDFKKIVKSKSGIRYKRIEDIAKDILANGYSDKYRQYPPDDAYLRLIGKEELGIWDSDNPNRYNGKSYEDKDKENYGSNEVPF